MSELIKKKGFNFAFDPKICSKCKGNCCIGESGYIWINLLEIQRLSFYFGITIEEFKEKFLEKVGYRFSIKEKKLSDNNYACLFFDVEKRQCSIYEYRPEQCRTFPFWDYFRKNEKEVFEECPAIKKL